MPDRIITHHISPYIAAQGTVADLAAMGVTHPPVCATPGCDGRPVIRLDGVHLCRVCYGRHEFGDGSDG